MFFDCCYTLPDTLNFLKWENSAVLERITIEHSTLRKTTRHYNRAQWIGEKNQKVPKGSIQSLSGPRNDVPSNTHFNFEISSDSVLLAIFSVVLWIFFALIYSCENNIKYIRLSWIPVVRFCSLLSLNRFPLHKAIWNEADRIDLRCAHVWCGVYNMHRWSFPETGWIFVPCVRLNRSFIFWSLMRASYRFAFT